MPIIIKMMKMAVLR